MQSSMNPLLAAMTRYDEYMGSGQLTVRGGGGTAKYNGVTNVAGRTTSNLARERNDFLRIHTRNQPFDSLAAVGDHIEPTPMMRAFFSRQNMQIVLNGICAEVYLQSGDRQYVIPYQNPVIVAERMRNEFMAALPYDPRNAREDIRRLNSLVIKGEVRSILRNIAFQQYHKEQMSVLPVNEFLPENTSSKRHTFLYADKVLLKPAT